MRRFVNCYFIFILFFILPACYGQNKKINNTTQNWSEIDLIGKINEKWKWQADIQYSRQSSYESMSLFRYNQQLTLRSWIHYFIKPSIKLSAFFGLWYSYAISKTGARTYPEYRMALQTQFLRVFGKNLISNRFRTEIREIEDQHNVFETVFRGRYLLKYQRLLNHSKYDKNSSYFILFDELFLNTGSQITGYKPFDQNRIFIGWGYNLTNNIAVETGYFNQFVHHAHDTNFDSNHIWQASLLLVI